ncbi:hypothetical protein ACERK3_15640 [Phycisphaerales bacterium AB-hyl4]|uniref:Uncharacterized protein n=1 Tax=Natronomicrosphaera hydrolytica TaxID=3242702 RepID=A0ABV4U7Y5_9BACT
MPKLYSIIIVAAAALLAGQVAIITAQPGEASGPSPDTTASDTWGTWHGLWTDSNGGTLRVVDRGDTILFDLDVVRGPTEHVGYIAGQAERNRTLARFSDKDLHIPEKPEDDAETWLSFIHRGDTLELVGANTLLYHGARAYFDGQYTRVEPLSEVAVEEVEVAAAGADE